MRFELENSNVHRTTIKNLLAGVFFRFEHSKDIYMLCYSNNDDERYYCDLNSGEVGKIDKNAYVILVKPTNDKAVITFKDVTEREG